MTKLLTVLSAWLALCCFMGSGSAMRLGGAGQALVVPSPRAVPADVAQGAYAVQSSEIEDWGAFQGAGAEPGLHADLWSVARGLAFPKVAWQQAWLESPRRQAMLGVALARAPPSWHG